MAAIYMWRAGEFVVITTTPYPVVAEDELLTVIAIKSGVLGPIPGSELESTQTIQDGTYIQVRWFYEDGPYDSDLESTQTMVDGTYIQTRWFYEDGPYDSDLEATQIMLDGTLINKLVEADSPDEKLQLNLAINSNCSMDAI